ncbi:unnamed protein product [Moneuplotes crassus]|uniref:Uncharacterized protein n=1 Tax=Euplotes crassus TaxID=5936 RepID=A0AAD1XA65_EUPCR|nr:unnamed protein product [Moneuplotes crassus]
MNTYKSPFRASKWHKSKIPDVAKALKSFKTKDLLSKKSSIAQPADLEPRDSNNLNKYHISEDKEKIQQIRHEKAHKNKKNYHAEKENESDEMSPQFEDVSEHHGSNLKSKVRNFWEDPRMFQIPQLNLDSNRPSTRKSKEENGQAKESFSRKFVREFWRIIHKQNQRIDNLLNLNSELKHKVDSGYKEFV